MINVYQKTLEELSNKIPLFEMSTAVESTITSARPKQKKIANTTMTPLTRASNIQLREIPVSDE